MITQEFDILIGGIWLTCLTAFVAIHIAMPVTRYIRAWLYVRFFIRYEMAGCALEAKVREGQR